MYPSVQSAFHGFNTPFEGAISFMYQDVKGLVTIGVGNLIDPVQLAQALPFRFKSDGTSASVDQITAEWQAIKNNPTLARAGYRACEPITQLELSDDSINSLVAGRLAQNESFLKRQPWFQAFDAWPADAQMGLLSMAWAMGPGGPETFPKFCAACQKLDFVTAAAECKMDESGNPGLIPRNRANFTLFSNAAVVHADAAQANFQRAALYYPQVLKAIAAAAT